MSCEQTEEFAAALREFRLAAELFAAAARIVAEALNNSRAVKEIENATLRYAEELNALYSTCTYEYYIELPPRERAEAIEECRKAEKEKAKKLAKKILGLGGRRNEGA